MALYDILKDAASIVQKTQNIELIQTFLNAQQQALELMEENKSLKSQIEKMQDTKELKRKVERQTKGVYITLSDDDQKIKYCSVCFDVDEKIVQMLCASHGGYYCKACKIKESTSRL